MLDLGGGAPKAERGKSGGTSSGDKEIPGEEGLERVFYMGLRKKGGKV